jgi:predicted glycosyltransferase involved in capsule biosynthesis
MKTVIVIPWRPQPSRVKAYNLLLDFFNTNFPEFPIIVSDNPEKNFSVGTARNLGAKKAIEMGADLIVFNDADLFVSADSLREAIDLARKTNEIVLPYTSYITHRTQQHTDLFFEDLNCNTFIPGTFVDSPPKILDDGLPSQGLVPCSGCLVVPVKIFTELGGYLELEGWAPEDTMLHRKYFDLYQKLFKYTSGTAHSTFNETSQRVQNPKNASWLAYTFFLDKRLPKS